MDDLTDEERDILAREMVAVWQRWIAGNDGDNALASIGSPAHALLKRLDA